LRNKCFCNSGKRAYILCIHAILCYQFTRMACDRAPACGDVVRCFCRYWRREAIGFRSVRKGLASSLLFIQCNILFTFRPYIQQKFWWPSSSLYIIANSFSFSLLVRGPEQFNYFLLVHHLDVPHQYRLVSAICKRLISGRMSCDQFTVHTRSVSMYPQRIWMKILDLFFL
jgi:hypothetical protein